MVTQKNNRIAFVLPYFGRFPRNFELWLKGCSFNRNIDFLIFTDDETPYNYPDNVIVTKMSFDALKDRIQKMFDFDISIDRPWRICAFRPAFGEIFQNEIEHYEFWGYCDVDLMWGDISAFITDEILEKYDRIGTKGHASIYKNSLEVNARYKNIVSPTANYVSVFKGEINYAFDENGMDEIYDALNIPYYFKPYFLHLEKFEPGFYINRLPKEKLYTNKYQVFLWEKGKVYRICLDKGELVKTEYMCVHFFCRPMTYQIGKADCDRYIMYPDIMKPFDGEITKEYVMKHGTQTRLVFYAKMLWFNRKKISIKKIMKNISIARKPRNNGGDNWNKT